MKKIILYTIFTIIYFSSCKKSSLDVVPDSLLSPATFWRNADDATQAATQVYARWSSAHRFQLFYADLWSDDAITTGFWNGFYYGVWAMGNISPQDDGLNGLWGNIYAVIRTANVFLANVDKCVMDESLKKRLIAEVKFLRAFEYQYLYNTWGEVPLTDKPLTTDELRIPRAEAGQTLAFIVKDLDEAIADLPVTPPQKGRVTKGAALAMKARVLLYDGKYAEAAVAAKAAMDLNQYELLRTPNGDGYFQLCNTTLGNNREVILSWQYDGVTSSTDIPSNFRITGTLFSPTEALVATYDCYDRSTDKLVAVDESSVTNRFTNRDPRLDFSILHTGSRDPLGSTILNSESGLLATHSTGYGVRKFYTDDLINNVAKPDTDDKLIRYAEVLLTYAEAKIENNQIDQSVADAINEVRSRAYGAVKENVGAYPEVVVGGQAVMRTEVRKERRVELAFEGLRWFDIKRWRIAAGAGGTMNGPVKGAKKADGTFFNAGTRLMSDAARDYLRPIPQRQIDLTGKDVLRQNPGY